MERLVSVFLLSVSLPHLDKNYFFQLANLLSIESIVGSEMQESLYLDPIGMPKYKMGNLVALYPMVLVR